MEKISVLAVLLPVLFLISCSSNVSSSKTLSVDDSLAALSNTEVLSDAESDSEKSLPISITLTRSSATGIFSETTFANTPEIEEIVELLSDYQPLPDEDKDILHRDGGTTITALFQMDLEISYTIDLIFGSPKSLDYEILMLRGETEKYYTDVKVFDSLLEIIENEKTPSPTTAPAPSSSSSTELEKSSESAAEEPEMSGDYPPFFGAGELDDSQLLPSSSSDSSEVAEFKKSMLTAYLP